jgi:glyoxylase-like metal-dependent hydrolase (beta-lactamase superfamily II)
LALEDDFSDIVKKARQGLGLSIGDLAQRCGLPPGDITVLERNGRAPKEAEAQALATALSLRAAQATDIAWSRWRPDPTPETDLVVTIHGDIGGYAVKGYLLCDRTAKEALLIDTGYNPSSVLDTIERLGVRLKGVCLTHGHSDHADGMDEILQHHHVPVYLGAGDVPLLSWRPPTSLLIAPEDGRTIPVGRLTVRCLATPGHTPGGICYRVEQAGADLCFVGDTLFAGSIGRSNPFSLYATHLESVRRRVLQLPPQTLLLPGHGPATTVREETEHNPFAGG